MLSPNAKNKNHVSVCHVIGADLKDTERSWFTLNARARAEQHSEKMNRKKKPEEVVGLPKEITPASSDFFRQVGKCLEAGGIRTTDETEEKY